MWASFYRGLVSDIAAMTAEPPIEVIEATPLNVAVEIATEPEAEYVSLGEFKITAYCSCAKCCGEWANKRPDGIVYGACGKELVADYSIAVDPRVIPYGTTVYFDGREHIAHDCGGAIKENRIDLYMSTHEAALEWGVQYHDVYLIREAVI